jgi:hypothetical protein
VELSISGNEIEGNILAVAGQTFLQGRNEMLLLIGFLFLSLSLSLSFSSSNQLALLHLPVGNEWAFWTSKDIWELMGMGFSFEGI